ncbi:MAG: FCD domain-containing protein [Chloroflexia bacterium]|nr:FCD domain-containing protein [Chloroflexia bacterium]MDQ3411786.1 FCD domain-containing protein [Chloroflexota bacterium]
MCRRRGDRWRRANTAFHVALARASGNDRLAKLVEVTLEELNRVLYLPTLLNVRVRTEASVPEHERIIAALRARDVHAAELAAAAHIAPNRQFVIDALISSPRLRSLNLIVS